MSEPLKYNAQSELVGAISALNTQVTYTGPDMVEDEWVFISSAEPMAKHSIEHISAAMEMMTEIRSKDLRNIRVVF
jgi:hypothetical protein